MSPRPTRVDDGRTDKEKNRPFQAVGDSSASRPHTRQRSPGFEMVSCAFEEDE